jgi:hypothetical protein
MTFCQRGPFDGVLQRGRRGVGKGDKREIGKGVRWGMGGLGIGERRREGYPGYYFVIGPGVIICPGMEFFSDPS